MVAHLQIDRVAPAARRPLGLEILIVLAVSFGLSGLRALVRLAEALWRPENLNEQTVTLSRPQSTLWWADLALQLLSSATLMSYAALAVFLLHIHHRPHGNPAGPVPQRWLLGPVRRSDWGWALVLAAAIAIPGLLLYLVALSTGWSRVVIPSGYEHPVAAVPVLVLWSVANAVGEETVVVLWLVLRLRQLGWSWAAVTASSAVLRGSYHLYQGVSAGLGNAAMGVLCVAFFARTGRMWPLILAHALIDIVAFVGYALIPPELLESLIGALVPAALTHIS